MIYDMYILIKIKNRLRRLCNNLHRYDFHSSNNGWVKIINKPVYGDEITGSVFDPYSFIYKGHIKMLVSERKTGTLSCIISTNGINWSGRQLILEGIYGTWQNSVNRGCLLFNNGKWHLWYTGQNNVKSSIGYAVSIDGVVFKRMNNCDPVLEPEFFFEGNSVMNPCVLWDEESKLYKMWYSAGEMYEPDVICYATSTDGCDWKKNSQPVLDVYPKHKWERYKIGGCSIIKNNHGYMMYYIGYQNMDVARICFAYSKDGINWERPGNNYIIGPSKGCWDSDAVYKPSVLEYNNKLYLWYNGRRKNKEYIGLAIKNHS